jgi:hypothetical protein
VQEVFNGFISFDAKFWRTIIPLLTSPGKVTKNYVSGKRNRYSNPFRFYLTVSIFFFLIVGLSISKNKFEKLTQESAPDITDLKKEDYKITTDSLRIKNIDSLKKEVLDKMNASFIPIPDARKKQVLKEKEIKNGIKDTTALKLGNGNKILVEVQN